MDRKHYKDQMAAFVNRELSKEEQQQIGEHLLKCTNCRAEHDRIKFGVALASKLRRADAPDTVWTEIERELDGKRAPEMTFIPKKRFFEFRTIAGYAVAVVLVLGLASLAYLTLFRPSGSQTARETEKHGPVQSEQTAPQAPPNTDEQSANTQIAGSNTQTGPAAIASLASWQFEAVSGTPKVGTASTADRLAVGDFLETDAASRARISVADIGQVEIEPNSRVKLVGTTAAEHRLSLERGVLQAKISAPPRLFIVDTPSAVAVDLGCEYKLEVDRAGNSHLSVTKGFVSLEIGARESIVPAGTVCVTKRGRGLGTPFAADTSEKFRAALERFDFEKGGTGAVQDMLSAREFYDMITLWHLLTRVQKTDREKVYDALSEYVKPPAEVTREGIISLDKKMLTLWRTEVERVWFE